MSTKIVDIKQDGFERVVEVRNDKVGLYGYVAIHNLFLGPALGGIRYKEYNAGSYALRDVCELACAMTKKNSLANINYGGGKAVIIKHSSPQNREDVYKAMGEAIEQLNGLYICCEDMGTVTQDLYSILETTKHCTGTKSNSGISTAEGLFYVFETYCSCEEIKLSDITVTVVGLGKVGWALAELLYLAGVSLNVSDIDDDRMIKFWREHNPNKNNYISPLGVAHQEGCEVYSPCAVGGILNRHSRQDLNCNAIIGSANNQLDTKETARWLHKRGILYFPDYLVNAGGVIALAAELDNQMDNLNYSLWMIGERSQEIRRLAESQHRSLFEVTENLAFERLKR